MSRDYATNRVRQGSWSPFADLPVDVDARAKYLEHARTIKNAFNTPAGRAVLDLMIANYLVRTTAPESAEDAMFRAGQASVVTHILHNMKIATGD